MLRPAAARPCGAPAARLGACWLLAGLLAIPSAAQAQAFTLPKACVHGASGNEGFDPVVLVVDHYANQWITSFGIGVVGQNPIQWGATISPFRGGLSGYTIFTTYTPFLTSDVFVNNPSNWQSYNVFLPQPGVTGGRQTAIYDVFQVLIRDKSQSTPVPNAIVDVIPDYAGSSPLTIQADGQGVLTLFCVQQNFQGYNVTVYDASGNYLYDGSIPGSKSSQVSALESEVLASRPHPDEPEPEEPQPGPPQ